MHPQPLPAITPCSPTPPADETLNFGPLEIDDSMFAEGGSNNMNGANVLFAKASDTKDPFEPPESRIKRM